MNNIGILVALPIEANGLSAERLRVGQTVRLAHNVILCVTGIGRENARIGALSLIKEGAEALVSWGTAGGLAPRTRAGHLVVPSRVMDQHGNFFYTDSGWHSNLFHILCHIKHLTIYAGSLLQTTQVVTSVSIKKTLFEKHQAVAVDMESVAIASVAHQACLPFVVVRAIYDPASASLPVWFNKVLNSRNELDPLKFAWHFSRHPSSWFHSFALFFNYLGAKNTLSTSARWMLWSGL